jgi:ubiquinone/menaquinone biosynthesis C-methylase UbiE
MTGSRQTPERVHAAYNATADAYADRFFDELRHKAFDRKMLDWLVQRVGTSGQICDLGCGPGQVARYLHSQGADACGIDLSPQMVKIARALNFGVSFDQGNMLDLQRVPGASFAGIAAFYAIVNLSEDELPVALAEMRRVLIPGGWLLLSFHVGNETHHVEDFLERKVALDFTFFRPADVRARLTGAGFNVTELMVRDPYPGVEYPSERAYIFAQAQEAA